MTLWGNFDVQLKKEYVSFSFICCFNLISQKSKTVLMLHPFYASIFPPSWHYPGGWHGALFTTDHTMKPYRSSCFEGELKALSALGYKSFRFVSIYPETVRHTVWLWNWLSSISRLNFLTKTTAMARKIPYVERRTTIIHSARSLQKLGLVRSWCPLVYTYCVHSLTSSAINWPSEDHQCKIYFGYHNHNVSSHMLVKLDVYFF